MSVLSVLSRRPLMQIIYAYTHETLTQSRLILNPSTAGAVDFHFLHFLKHITYHLLNILKIKSDINQQDLKFVDLHFVNSE